MLSKILAIANNLDAVHSLMRDDRDYPGGTKEIELAMKGWQDVYSWCARNRGADYAATLRKQFETVWQQACNYGAVCGETLDAPGIADIQDGKPVRLDNRRADRWTQQTMTREMLACLANYLRDVANELGGANALVPNGASAQRGEKVGPEYLDAFKFISKGNASDVNNVTQPLKAYEVEVRKAFEEMLGEAFHAKDSGSESCDMFTLQGSHEGQQRSVAAIFKGARNTSIKWPLQIAGCGKNGNQVVRLFEVPADVYMIQANGPFDPTLIKHIQNEADARACRHSCDVRYILIDGAMTARLLGAARRGLL